MTIHAVAIQGPHHDVPEHKIDNKTCVIIIFLSDRIIVNAIASLVPIPLLLK